MTDLNEAIARAPIHEFQVVHRTRPGDGSPGWSQEQSEWGNAMLAHDTISAHVAAHGLDPHELVGAAAERAAEASAELASQSSAPDAGGHPGAATEPQGM